MFDDRPGRHGEEAGRRGVRPAYNVPFATDTKTQVIVGVAVVTHGSDADQMTPMVDQIQERDAVTPAQSLVDGGFASHAPIEAMSAPRRGGTVYAPVPKPTDATVDRHASKPTDSPAVAGWRQRRATAQAQAIDNDRAATAECVNALTRNGGRIVLHVRGRLKMKAIVRWHALAQDLLRAVARRAAAIGTM